METNNIYYTKEEIEIAKKANIMTYIQSKGITTKREGARYRSEKDNYLIFTLPNKYYLNYKSRGGNTLDFAQDYFNLKFEDAVKDVLDSIGVQINRDEQIKRAYLVKSNDNNNRMELDSNEKKVIAYLSTTRNISEALILNLIRDNLLAQTKINDKYHFSNCAFIIKDESGENVGIELNTTLSNARFKGVEAGSKYGYGFNIGSKKPEEAFYFESAIDMISFMQLLGAKELQNRLKNSIFISMSGLKENIVSKMQEVYKAKKIYICVDNPKFEKQTLKGKPAEIFINDLRQKFDFQTIQTKEYKDWNEMLSDKNRTKSFAKMINVDVHKKKTIVDIVNADSKEYVESSKFKIITKKLDEKKIDKSTIDIFNNSLKLTRGRLIDNKSTTLVISDGVINCLSLVDIMKSNERNIDTYSFLMNDVETIQNEIDKYVENNNINKIVIAFSSLNSDKAIEIEKNYIKSFSTLVYSPKLGDFNTDLRALMLKEEYDDERSRKRNNEISTQQTGRTIEYNKNSGRTITLNGKIRNRNHDLSERELSDTIHGVVTRGGIINKVEKEGTRSKGNEEKSNITEEGNRTSGSDNQLGRKSTIGKDDRHGSRELSNEGISSKNYIKPIIRGVVTTGGTVKKVEVEKTQIEKNIEYTKEIKKDINLINYRQTEEVFYGGQKEKYKNNISSIRILKEIEKENRMATNQEQSILSKYTGWGGMPQAFDSKNDKWSKEYEELKNLLNNEEYTSARASTPNAHYTDKKVIESIYKALENFGFVNGKILEPSMGIGHFYASLPDSMQECKLHGVELDDISGRLSKQLFQNATIKISGFEDTNFANNYFDIAIGNIPFGNYQVYDNEFRNHKFLIHDYFFAKTLNKVRSGGIIAFVTSKGTMDKADTTVRQYIANRAKLIGAIRLPNNTFKSIANTKVTTDIIFLQKRDMPIISKDDWIYINKNENGIPVNNYYIDNPNMMLGELIFDKSMYGNEKDTALINDKDISEDLIKAINKLEANYTNEIIEKKELSNTIPASDEVRNYSYTVIEDKLYYRINSEMYIANLKGIELKKAKALHYIRNTIREIIEIQKEDYEDKNLKEKQTTLNNQYDNFVNKFGYINDKNNQKVFDEDIDHILLKNLENENKSGQFEKSEFFYKATIEPREEITINSSKDALIISLNNKGKVDLKYMKSIYNKELEEIIADLKNEIFFNPKTNEYESKEEYLSGNVKDKLKDAIESNLNENIEALKKVQPKDLTIDQIGFKVGSSWIPVEIYQKFMYETFGTYPRNKVGSNRICIIYNKISSEYKITNKTSEKDNIYVNSNFGTESANAYRLLEDILNLKTTTIHRYDPKGVDSQKTQLARSKQELIKNAFVNYVLKNNVKEVEKNYNEKMNVFVPRKFDGSNLIIPAMNKNIKLRPHQKNIAMRILTGGNVLIAHEVGAGKTFSMAAGAKLLKDAKIANKPLFVIPNHMLRQWAREYTELFPYAKILFPSKKDFIKNNRKKFVSKIAYGEYDAVFLTFSQFEKIPMSKKFLEEQIQKDIDEVVEAIKDISSKDVVSIKAYETIKKNLNSKLQKLSETEKKDDLLDFNELGIDYLFIDEAHNYKNCYVHTRMNNVAGISVKNTVKSYDMLMKIRYITQKQHGKGIVFATGTPITNSITEMYVMQRYLQNESLKEIGITHFDRWAATYGDVKPIVEIGVTGQDYTIRHRFNEFHNMPELMKMFSNVADFVKVDDLPTIERPEGKMEVVISEPDEYIKDKILEFSERADRIKSGIVQKEEDNMAWLTVDGKMLAIDPSLLDSSAPVNPDGKILKCIDKVIDLHKKYNNEKALQVLFLDLGISLYEVIKKELVERGINENEIGIITYAKNDVQKEELFKKCRSGEVRILMGSTAKLGTGTNIQNRMIALHHIDSPWRPSDFDQREGRILRQGNMFKKVHIYRYVMKGTFDSYLWQILEKKQAFIQQIMKNNYTTRSYDDIDDTTLQYGEIKALCLACPEIQEKATIDNDIQKINLERANFIKTQTEYRYKIENLPTEIKQLKENLIYLEKDIKKLKINTKKDFYITFEGITYTKRVEAAKKLNEIMNNSIKENIGVYKGFSITSNDDLGGNITLEGSGSNYTFLGLLEKTPLSNIRKIESLNKSLPKKYEKLEIELEIKIKNLESARNEYGKSFEKETLLVEKIERQTELNFLIDEQLKKQQEEKSNSDEKNKNEVER